jgi:hypothetical protein
MFFIGSLMTRGFYALVAWEYPFVSIGTFFGIEGVHEDFLGWDRSLLLLGLSIASGMGAAGFIDLSEWARATPNERRLKREQARRAVAKQHGEERQERAARKAARKPMSGWRRLWIALSVLFAIPTAFLAYEVNSRLGATIAYIGDDEKFWRSAHEEPDLSGCNWRTAEATFRTGNGWWVACQAHDPITPAFLWALVPALLMAVGGLLVRWVYRGFRPTSPPA